jgi:hypothetical protein
MRLSTYYLSTILLITTFCLPAKGTGFRIPPYIQNPSTDRMSILWFSNDNTPGLLTYRRKDAGTLTGSPILVHLE